MKKLLKGVVLFFAVVILLAIFITGPVAFAAIVFAGAIAGVWYFTSKKPNRTKMYYMVALAAIALLGVALPKDNTSVEQSADSEESVVSEENSEEEAESKAKAEEESRAAEEQAKAESEEQAKAESEEQARIESEEAKKAEEEAAAQKAIEEAEKALQEAEAKLKDPNSYRTDLTYENLARTPEEFYFEMVAIKGTVVQVMEGDGFTQYRVAWNDNYDQIVLVELSDESMETRLLENDWVNIYGYYMGMYSYETVLGAEMSVPAITANMMNLVQ